MNSSNIAGDRNLNYHENEVDIPVISDVVIASETDEHILNQPTAPPFEVFTTTVSNVLEWLVAEIIT